MKMAWTRPRIALVAGAAVSGLAMFFVGLFQIGWIDRLACPGFGSGCESVALARFSWPFGVADGLLLAALCGIVCALAQIPRRNAALVVVGLAAIWLVLNAVGIAEMARFGAFCSWRLLSAALAVPILALAVVAAREHPASGGQELG
jgi:hypothetical protein